MHSDPVASVSQFKLSLEGIWFEWNIVSQDAISRPFGTRFIKSFVDSFHLVLCEILIHFVLNAHSSEVPTTPRILIEDNQSFVIQVNNDDSVWAGGWTWWLHELPGSALISLNLDISVFKDLTAVLIISGDSDIPIEAVEDVDLVFSFVSTWRAGHWEQGSDFLT